MCLNVKCAMFRGFNRIYSNEGRFFSFPLPPLHWINLRIYHGQMPLCHLAVYTLLTIYILNNTILYFRHQHLRSLQMIIYTLVLCWPLSLSLLVSLSIRGIKIWRTIKTKLPFQFCMNDLTIMIGQLGFV